MANASLQVAGFNAEDLITYTKSDFRTLSIAVAKVFGKRHDDVLRKIKSLDCSAEFFARNFAEIPVDVDLGLGRSRKSIAYEMTKDGFMYVVMGFTGKKAAAIKEAYINAFNWMAEQLVKNETRQPKQKPLIGEPLLNEAVTKEISRTARMLAGRTYTHYKNRLLQEALKTFPTDPAKIGPIAEKVWYNEQQRDEIDGVPVETLQHAYNLCMNYLICSDEALPLYVRQNRLAVWQTDMAVFKNTLS